MTNYNVQVKYVNKREAESIDEAIMRELRELPQNGLVLEAFAFPSRVDSKKDEEDQ